MDNKTFKDMLGLGDDYTEENVQFLKGQMKDLFGDEKELTPEQIEILKEKIKKQKELFEADARGQEMQDEFGAPEVEHVATHGLPEICDILITDENNGRTFKEKIYKLSEVFLPQNNENKIKDKLEAYNRAKMPYLK